MTPSETLSLFMSIEALLLAASTLGVSIYRSRAPGEQVRAARTLADGCTRLTVVLSAGGFIALGDLYARKSMFRRDCVEVALDVAQGAVIAIVLVALPLIAARIARAAGREKPKAER